MSPLRTRASAVLTPVVKAAEPYRVPLLGVAVALGLVGSIAAWTTKFIGYPGRVSGSALQTGLGGLRLLVLVLTVSLVVAFRDVPGRRRASIALTFSLLVIGVWNLYRIAQLGGSISVAAVGVWAVLLSGLVGVVASLALPADQPVTEGRPRPPLVEAALVVGSVALAEALLVYGLVLEDQRGGKDQSERFVSFLIAVTALLIALNALGITPALQRLYQRRRAWMLGAVAFGAVIFPITLNGEDKWLHLGVRIAIFAAAAIGLNIVVGLAGLLDLGYIAFLGVGAYMGALLSDAALTTSSIVLPIYFALIVGACCAMLFGVLIGAPTLRLRGDYLAIVTLAFGEIFRICMQNDIFGLTRGPNGIAQIPGLDLLGIDFDRSYVWFGVKVEHWVNYYFLGLILATVCIVCFSRLNASRIGRAWVAIREDETAAEAMGINTVALKLLAFAFGAFLAGAAGVVSAPFGGSVEPTQFEFLNSVFLLAAVVLGGMGTVPGAILGSALLLALPQKLEAFERNKLLVFGIALVLMMRFRPEGIIASSRRKLEFHDDNPNEGDGLGAAPGGPLAEPA